MQELKKEKYISTQHIFKIKFRSPFGKKLKFFFIKINLIFLLCYLFSKKSYCQIFISLDHFFWENIS